MRRKERMNNKNYNNNTFYQPPKPSAKGGVVSQGPIRKGMASSSHHACTYTIYSFLHRRIVSARTRTDRDRPKPERHSQESPPSARRRLSLRSIVFAGVAVNTHAQCILIASRQRHGLDDKSIGNGEKRTKLN